MTNENNCYKLLLNILKNLWRFLSIKLKNNANQQTQMQIDWNDVNDSDSSVEGCVQLTLPESKQYFFPKLKQIQSTSIPHEVCQKDKQSKKFTKKVVYNMEKIDNFQNKNVWLFVPKTRNKKSRQIQLELNEIRQIIRLEKNKGGWNVLIGKSEGKKLVQKGIQNQKQKSRVKFIFSSKNTCLNYKNKQTQFVENSFGLQKKHSLNEPRKVKYKEKTPILNQENKEQSERKQNRVKQTVKNGQFLEQTKKIQQNQLIQNSNEQNEINQLPQSNIQLITTFEAENQQRKPQVNQNQSQLKQKQYANPHQNKEGQLDQNLQLNEYNSDLDSQQSLKRMKKTLKKKHKKRKNKTSTAKTNTNVDHNNPFCILANF